MKANQLQVLVFRIFGYKCLVAFKNELSDLYSERDKKEHAAPLFAETNILLYFLYIIMNHSVQCITFSIKRHLLIITVYIHSYNTLSSTSKNICIKTSRLEIYLKTIFLKLFVFRSWLVLNGRNLNLFCFLF